MRNSYSTAPFVGQNLLMGLITHITICALMGTDIVNLGLADVHIDQSATGKP